MCSEDLGEEIAKRLVVGLDRGLFDVCLKAGCCEAGRGEQKRFGVGEVDLAEERVKYGAEEFLLCLEEKY